MFWISHITSDTIKTTVLEPCLKPPFPNSGNSFFYSLEKRRKCQKGGLRLRGKKEGPTCRRRAFRPRACWDCEGPGGMSRTPPPWMRTGVVRPLPIPGSPRAAALLLPGGGGPGRCFIPRILSESYFSRRTVSKIGVVLLSNTTMHYNL